MAGAAAGEFNSDTGVLKPHTLYFEDWPKRVRVVFGGETVADAAFSYSDPLPKVQKAAGHLCFLGEGVTVKVDGEVDPEQ